MSEAQEARDAPCPRCEAARKALDAAGAAALAAEIPLPESARAPEDALERRLAVCAGCPALREQFLCAYCGCFVVFRARIQQSYCPHPQGDRWLWGWGLEGGPGGEGE